MSYEMVSLGVSDERISLQRPVPQAEHTMKSDWQYNSLVLPIAIVINT